MGELLPNCYPGLNSGWTCPPVPPVDKPLNDDTHTRTNIHTWTVLKFACWFGFKFRFCVCLGLVLCFCASLDQFIPVSLAFVVLGSVSSVPGQKIGWEERRWIELLCVEWDVKPLLSQPINLTTSMKCWTGRTAQRHCQRCRQTAVENRRPAASAIRHWRGFDRKRWTVCRRASSRC